MRAVEQGIAPAVMSLRASSGERTVRRSCSNSLASPLCDASVKSSAHHACLEGAVRGASARSQIWLTMRRCGSGQRSAHKDKTVTFADEFYNTSWGLRKTKERNLA